MTFDSVALFLGDFEVFCTVRVPLFLKTQMNIMRHVALPGFSCAKKNLAKYLGASSLSQQVASPATLAVLLEGGSCLSRSPPSMEKPTVPGENRNGNFEVFQGRFAKKTCF